MLNENKSNRIAKNTLMLYFRMLIVIIIGLYTSRVVLSSLGIDDYGLYNVIGGVVSLFSFFRTSMEKCTQRFLNVEMAKNNGNLSSVFSNALIIHIVLAIIVFFLAEVIGLWFLNNYIQIPVGREFAANIVYQTVIAGLIITIITIPYSACIIANEKMNVFALISIIDCILNLGVSFVISKSNNYDRLILYSILIFIIRFVNLFFYIIYCRARFLETHCGLKYDKTIGKDLLSYTSWTLVGHFMILGSNNGNSILVNMFHGVSANAAMAVANQVNGHVLNLTGSFQTAFNPQITKSYASKDYSYLQSLITTTSKFSYFLLFAIALPLFLNIDFILNLWLEVVPAETDIFCILMLSSGILQATTSPLNFSIMATGNIKQYQIITGLVYMTDLIFLYLLFSLGFPAPTAMWVKLSIMVIVCLVRFIYTHKTIPSINLIKYLRDVFLPIIYVTCICLLSAYFIMGFVSNIIEQVIASIIIVLLTCIVIVIIGLNKKEKEKIVLMIKRKK